MPPKKPEPHRPATEPHRPASPAVSQTSSSSQTDLVTKPKAAPPQSQAKPQTPRPTSAVRKVSAESPRPTSAALVRQSPRPKSSAPALNSQAPSRPKSVKTNDGSRPVSSEGKVPLNHRPKSGLIKVDKEERIKSGKENVKQPLVRRSSSGLKQSDVNARPKSGAEVKQNLTHRSKSGIESKQKLTHRPRSDIDNVNKEEKENAREEEDRKLLKKQLRRAKSKAKIVVPHPDIDEQGYKIVDASGQGITNIPIALFDEDIGSLDLSSNNFRIIPREIQQLINLTSLDLSKNGIKCVSETDYSGMPAEMAKLTQLTNLNISECNLPYVPPVIWKMTNLKVLNLSRNRINVLLPDVGNLLKLEQLNLQQTNIKTLPAEIVFCQKLNEILLFGNTIEKLPDTLPEMPNLTKVSMNYRSFSSILDPYMESLIKKGQIRSEHIPIVMYEMPSIESIDVENTKINYIPQMATENLKEFYVSRNFIHTMPQSLFNLKKLVILDMSDNLISNVPEELGQMVALTVLKLANNKIRIIPKSIGDLQGLEEINLGGNNIHHITVELTTLRNLRILILERNNIQTLPEEICNLTNLETLDLTENSIETLPRNMYKLTKLVTSHCYNGLRKCGLWLHRNPLTQPPKQIWVTDKIQDIWNYLKRLQIQETENLQKQKIVMLGATQSGKTTLSRTLLTQSSHLKEGLEEKTMLLSQVPWITDNGVQFIMFDIAGDPVYKFLHHLFLDEQAMVFLVFDASRYAAGRYDDMIGYWIDLLLLYCPGAVVQVIGTKVDRCRGKNLDDIVQDVMNKIQKQIQDWIFSVEDELHQITANSEDDISDDHTSSVQTQVQQLQNTLNHPITILPTIPVVSCAESFLGILDLIHDLELLAIDKSLFPHAQRYIPPKWGEFVCEVKQIENWCITWDEAAAIATRYDIRGQLLLDCIRYLRCTGELFWYENDPDLSNVVFHRPKLIVNVLTTLYRHDVNDFLNYNSSHVFMSHGNMTEYEFDKARKKFTKYGQISRPLLKCLWFYEQITRDQFDILLKLLPRLGICYVIPEPYIPTEKNFDKPLVVLPWYNQDINSEEGFNLWRDSLSENEAEVTVTYSFPLKKVPIIFEQLVTKSHDFFVERFDWKHLMIANGENVQIMLRRHKDCSIEVTVRSCDGEAFETMIVTLVTLMRSLVAQVPCLLWREEVRTRNTGNWDWTQCLGQ